jgi:uncharacterized membrane protein (DUF2068 family)
MMHRSPHKKHIGLEVIAFFKLFKALLLFGLSWGLFGLIHADLDRVARDLSQALRISSENEFVHKLQEQFVSLSPTFLHHAAVGALVYSILLFVEGTGLWFELKWAEYMVIINSGVFIPAEIVEIVHHPSWGPIVLLLVNLAIVGYVSMLVFWKVE